jgi:tRNA pseudouridine55 synthase
MKDGFLVVDKPAGMTSHDVVDEIRRRMGIRKVGHGGTLDPDATGVLLIGVGKATRFLSYAQASPKRYRARARFGVTTSTQDASGEVLTEDDADFDEGELREALQKMTGEQLQLPPMVSAVKVKGERLYHAARRGEEVERAPRPVTVYSLELLEVQMGARPEAVLDVSCSAGTYVRTLVADLGERLGCGAHLASLIRTEAGGIGIGEASSLEEVSEGHLRPLSDGVRSLAWLRLDESEEKLAARGRPLAMIGERAPLDGRPVALLSGDELVAVYKGDGRRLVAERVVPS